MELRVEIADVTTVEADALCLGLFETGEALSGAVHAVDRALDGQITQIVTDGDVSGERGTARVLPTGGRLPARRVVLAGLGPFEAFDADAVREAMATAVQAVPQIDDVATVAPDAGVGGLDIDTSAQALTEGARLGRYAFDRHDPTASGPSPLRRLRLVGSEPDQQTDLQRGAERGQRIAEAVVTTRDLANEPPSSMTPQHLAAHARSVAQARRLSCEVFDEDDLEEAGMGGILGVARGSEAPPRLIVLEHEGAPDAAPWVLAGKGVTFDSGGLSLKSRQGMLPMKHDMAGAAAVLGVMEAVAALELPVRVVGLMPAVENLPGGRAIKPSDVVRIADGTTVEVVNTDAEGRLILADALAYARTWQPRAVVDIATLTGASITALGDRYAALFSNDATLADGLRTAAQTSGEPLWELPLVAEYRAKLASPVAQIKNSVLDEPGPQPGAIAAGLFLETFVEGPWAHLDIAGPAADVGAPAYHPERGATGAGVRLLTAWLTRPSDDRDPPDNGA